ncbi:class A beta-lactamase [Undibacterium sp. TJN19]|uniref:class A beta-lactamase n=1 Tax=Undibacterium sp. TJN19 TaxID=3413055 RepID=UPI003BF2FFB7
MKKLYPFFITLMLYLLGPGSSNAQTVLDAIAQDSGGKLGASLLVIETGQSLWVNPDAAFPMQSVYKLPIVMAALAAVDHNKFKLEQKILVKHEELLTGEQHSPLRDAHPEGNFKITVEDLMRYAITESDSSASDVLLRLLGGPASVMHYLDQLGIHGMQVLDTEKEIDKSWNVQYRNTSTPKAMINLLQALHQGKALKPASQALLIKWMSETKTGQSRIKGMLPAGTPVAHKTGTSSSLNGLTAAHNDVGIVTLPNGHHMAVAIFLYESTAPEVSRDLSIAKITRVGWDAWSGK